MTSVTELSRRRAAPALGIFERYLTLWVALCILAGIVLGRMVPGPFQALGRMTVAEVNIPVAVLIWLMIVPMLLKVDFGALHRVAERWRGIAVTVGINWLVKPFSMALLAWLFIGWLFRPWLPAGQIDSYIAGLIILAAAPCTAMVFVWSNLTDGDPNFTLSQVALNDTIMVFAFAPIVALLLGLSSITVPRTTLFLSVVLYIVVPVIAAQLWRRSLLAQGGDAALTRALRTLQPISLIALLATLVLLFGFQGDQIVEQPLIIALLAIPIVFERRHRLRAQPGARGAAQCRLPLGLDRRIEFLRAGRCRGDRAVRFSIRRGACDRGGRVGRSAGHALGRADRVGYARLVRARADRLGIRPNIDGRHKPIEHAGGNACRCRRDGGDLQ
jgi:arsenite transporter